MENLSRKMIIRSAVVALILSAGIVTTANAEVTRLSGLDRYSTSDAIIKEGWPRGADTAVLAAGLDANTVDALTVAPFAKAKNAPVVLVNPKDSVETIVSKFTALNAKTVYIANGTGVISTQVDAGLKAAGIATVNRLGGINRYETALNIAKALGNSNSIVVASGDDAHLVDSLSIAPIAAAKGMPIFLTGSSLDADTTAYINGLEVKTTYVLGGTDTVADETVGTLLGVKRLAGIGRYETNAKVVDTFKADTALNLSNIFIASGEDENLIDSLAGAPLAASKAAPIIFAHDTINSDVNKLLKLIVNKTTKITEFGGTGAVTEAATNAINTIQTGVIKFPDKNLEQAIRDTIKKPTGDILIRDVENVTEINASKKGITNLSGIENLTNLTSLVLQYNGIKNIEPLKELINLRVLWLDSNGISNLEPLKGLTNLTSLRLSLNGISNIEPLKELTNLNVLVLSQNQITNIEPLRGLNNLTQLTLDMNYKLNNLEPLKELTNLSALSIYDSSIDNLEPLKGLINLTQLNLSSNQINNIEPLKELTNLSVLLLHGNHISNVELLKELTNLTELSLSTNEINNIEPLKGLIKLTVLDLSGSGISNIESLKGLTNLRDLSLDGNKISNLESLRELTSLTKLSLSANQISNLEPLKELTNLSRLWLERNLINNLEPLKGLTNLDGLWLYANNISNIEPLRQLINLNWLFLGNNQIKDYTPVNSYYNNIKYKDFTLQ